MQPYQRQMAKICRGHALAVMDAIVSQVCTACPLILWCTLGPDAGHELDVGLLRQRISLIQFLIDDVSLQGGCSLLAAWQEVFCLPGGNQTGEWVPESRQHWDLACFHALAMPGSFMPGIRFEILGG